MSYDASTSPAPLAPTVAALYVQENGCYYGLPAVDPWDKARDARRYAGPAPVVAHPPCQLWVNLAALNFKRYARVEQPGAFAGLVPIGRLPDLAYPFSRIHLVPAGPHRPLEPVRRPCVRRRRMLENTTPAAHRRERGGEAAAVIAGTVMLATANAPFELRWTRVGGTHQCGWFDRIKPTLSKREASATPPEFRDELIRLALHSTR